MNFNILTRTKWLFYVSEWSPRSLASQDLNDCNSYLSELLEKANEWTPAECPFSSNARTTSLKVPPLSKTTSQTLTPGVKPASKIYKLN